MPTIGIRSHCKTLGFYDESIAEMKQAIQADPLLDVPGSSGWSYFFARRYDEAIAVLREGLQRTPGHAFARSCLALNYAMKGMRAEASAEADKNLASLPTSEKGLLHLNVALVYAQVGRREDALTLLDECLASRRAKPVDTYTIAEIYAAMGEKDEAFKWLEKTYQDRLVTMFQLKTDPFMDNLRSDPRFKIYLKKAGFEK
jgi:tetratricopeptide (TPR) repeat protein